MVAPPDAAAAAPTGLARSARLVVWGGAVLRGGVSPDEAVGRIVGRDTVHRVSGVPGERGEVGLVMALGRLRALGARGLRLVLPAAGDVAGLPGPAAFNAEAVTAGEAVLTEGADAPHGLLPRVERLGSSGRSVRWDVSAVDVSPVTALPSLAEADRALTAALREATAELVRLDVARWDPAVADAVARLRIGGAAAELPPGYPPRAARVLETAHRVGLIAALARGGEGAAVSAVAMDRRRRALEPLARSSRYAVAAACNAVLEPARP